MGIVFKLNIFLGDLFVRNLGHSSGITRFSKIRKGTIYYNVIYFKYSQSSVNRKAKLL